MRGSLQFILFATYLTLAVYIAFVVLYHLSWNNYPSNYDKTYINKLYQNWNSSFILDVKIKTNGTCGDDFVYIAHPFGNWPGILGGCYCNGVFQLDNCGGCTSVPAIDSQALYSWNKVSYCAKFWKESYFDGIVLASSATTCPANMKSCGVVDSFNNFLCAPNSIPCPINKIVKTNSSGIPPDGLVYSQIDFNSGKLLFTNTSSTKPVTGFAIGDNTPCFNPFYTNRNFTDYALTYYYNRTTCQSYYGKTIDPDYTYLDTITYSSLLTENNIASKIKDLPQIGAVDYNHPTNLYYKSGFIGLNLTCYNDIRSKGQGEKIMAAVKNLKDFNIGKGLFWVTMGFSYATLLWCVLTIFIFFYRLIIFKESLNAEIKLHTMFVGNLWFFLPLFCWILISTIIGGVYFSQIRGAYDGEQLLKTFVDCADAAFKTEINNINTADIYNYALPGIIIVAINSGVFFFAWFTGICITCCPTPKYEFEDDMKKPHAKIDIIEYERLMELCTYRVFSCLVSVNNHI